MNAFIAGIVAELNAQLGTDTVEFSHYDANRKMVVRRSNTNKLYTYVKDERGRFFFLPA